MSPKSWKHKGAEITFDSERAAFFAVIKDKTVRGSSLDAVKKKIDAQARFEEWDCYVELTGWSTSNYKPEQFVGDVLIDSYCGTRGLLEGRVIGEDGFKNSRSSVRFQIQVLCKGKPLLLTEHMALPHTPEAAEAWRAYWTAHYAANKAEKELEARNKAVLEPLRQAIPYRKAGDQ